MAISTLMLALTGGGVSAPAPAPKPPEKSGLKEWVKKHLQTLGRALANLADMAAAPCPVSLAQLSLGSCVHWERLRLGSRKICGP